MSNEFRITLFTPEDAPDVSRFYKETYGDGFPLKYVYDPAEISRRYDGVNHRTTIVRDGEDRLAAMGSLFRFAPNPLLYEAGQLMVSKRHRGKGLSNIIGRVVLEEFPTQIPVDAVFIEALCSHTLSQPSATNCGLLPTGVELERIPPMGPKQDNGVVVNTSLLTLFRIYRDTPHTIHPHPDYVEFIERRNRALGIKRTVEPGASPVPPSTNAQSDVLRDASMATLTIFRAGKDLPDVLARFRAEAAGCSMHVRLDLGDRATPWAIDVLRGERFFLSAYLPLWFGTDGILLQKLPAAPDFSAPRYGSEAAKSMGDAVLADWEAVTGSN
ncbi:hypothetical protein DND132_3129 [Pseudodesulfovibrio mercurii]|uniref:N-acetyltransferase domain-containing protein n=1 Tax=Pseudodesulfovibrio mercurii TaxID=641491 RepID=F0JK83_9BACT|nr:hypothetical protein [Pseudodesulfovibrio mercurii]EGB16332.1 hypothetical protein DND132_3129 [Pseudodesulfovibrio mercurii]